ncbi:hypothetical protein K457DRAFT_114407 [Linnemannia elongata AG-77]|uniref:Guanylate cyclase domain-containing protein n=1 Tax=Linnemannia elongata AG-77 TaxID=1314771 RepID=A0A197JR02_9FUNG|nr:hypothetical protein K457DRAFT_114407 [Linnemannia elongata AG-77]
MPFHYTQFGAVLMVDIVGFSQMTSTASSKGDVGAEMLSSQIGAYFDLAIRIIEYHGGDVVKFLGDALLVVFQADPVCDDHQTDDSNNLTPMDSPTTEEPAAASRRSKVTVRKAVECGLELLARLSNYRIYLSEKEFSRKLSGPSVDENGQITGSGFGGNDDGSYNNFFPSNVNQSGNSNSQWNNTYTNASVISGNGSIGASSFLSVPINRPNSNGNHNNNHNNGITTRRSSNITPEDLLEDSFELQLHMAMSAGPISNIIIGDIGLENGLDNLLLQTTGRLEYAICGEQMSTIDDALGMARAGELTITAAAWSFVNPTAYPWYEERRHCFILKNIQSANDDPLLRRIRNDKLLNTSVESNPHYYKYINKSAIHRLILYPDNTFPAQFRTVTILFVSLGDVKPWTREGLDTCQKAIYQVHKVTSEYEGFIQQFAVDDKGATLLCAFGLPYPRSHEREAVFAAKSAWVIRRRLLAEGIHGFKISLATGVIFTSMIGNEFRRDPAIVGDTIVIAVRILKFDYATESVVCDDATKEACTSDHDGLCEFEEMGEEFVKGKMQRIRIWRLVHFGAKKQIRRPDDILVDETIGYEPERERVAQFIKTWEKEPDKNTILVAGPRGSGKSMFYQQICHIADRNDYNVCSAASAEVEKNTEYYLCKFLLLGLFDIMQKREIPYAGRTHLDLGIAFGQANYESQNLTPTTMASTIISGGPDESVAGTPCSANSFYSPIGSYFGPSVRSSMVSSSPWDLSTYITKLQSLINVSLQKMGEGDEMMHMLHDIIAALSSDNSAPVMNDRDDQMLADFIVRMLNYASSFVKIIVMFEDVQWTDNKSLHIIQVIHERCPAVLVVIFSRPQRDYGSNPLHGLTGHAKHLEIALEGLKRREIELALLKTFEDKNVTRINPAVIELVQEKTKGNPKFVKNMTTMLKDFCFVNIVDGELLTTGKESIQTPSYKNMEEMLVKQDRKKMILMQYDRMTARFQDFLKIASCLGQQFSLAEVAAIRPLETMLGVPEPGRSFPTMISDLDMFRFLSLATEQLMNVQFSDNVSMNTLYMFSSESTAKDIYESIPYEERVGYHLTMGQFYEAFLEPAQFSDLLPLITRHYLKTDHTEKKIKYLMAISAFDLKSNMLSDATQSLTELIQILDTVRGATNLVSQEDLADIYGMKGEALSKRMRIEEAEPALLDSLARYGVHWPKNSQQWKMALFVEKTKFIFHYHGGTTPGLVLPGKSVKAKVDARTQVTLQRIIRVLGCLQNIYFWKTEPNAAMLSTLYTLNYSRRLGLPSGEQTVSLGRYAILNYFKGNHHTCREYMQKARLANEAGEGTEGMLPSMQGYVEYCEGHRERAHAYLSEAINESKSFGVVSNLATYYRSVTLKCSYRMWEGSFNVHPEDSALLRAMSAVAIQNGDSEGETLFAIPTLANLLLQDRLRDAESWVVLIERFILPKARLMNRLVMHGMLSYYYAKMGQFNKTRIYATLLSERISDQGVAAHPFPLMSCAFVVMAIFVLLDSASPSLVNSPVDPLLASDTELILRPVIQCLSQDPFQPVSECFMTLADSIRCFILQGAHHQREGYQKLLRDWERSRSQTQGIQFVQAYYLSKLGQYADVAEEKDGFYSEAYVLFKRMSMDPTDWLTDPSPNWQPPFVAELPLPEFSVPTPS